MQIYSFSIVNVLVVPPLLACSSSSVQMSWVWCRTRITRNMSKFTIFGTVRHTTSQSALSKLLFPYTHKCLSRQLPKKIDGFPLRFRRATMFHGASQLTWKLFTKSGSWCPRWGNRRSDMWREPCHAVVVFTCDGWRARATTIHACQDWFRWYAPSLLLSLSLVRKEANELVESRCGVILYDCAQVFSVLYHTQWVTEINLNKFFRRMMKNNSQSRSKCWSVGGGSFHCRRGWLI